MIKPWLDLANTKYSEWQTALPSCASFFVSFLGWWWYTGSLSVFFCCLVLFIHITVIWTSLTWFFSLLSSHVPFSFPFLLLFLFHASVVVMLRALLDSVISSTTIYQAPTLCQALLQNCPGDRWRNSRSEKLRGFPPPPINHIFKEWTKCWHWAYILVGETDNKAHEEVNVGYVSWC